MTSHVTCSLVAFVELLFISLYEKRREREKKGGKNLFDFNEL
jgi:hypothetical protein